jgi:pilus assembly protein CpaB
MKRFLPLLIGLAIFGIALVMMKPEATIPILVAAADLPAGHTLVEADLNLIHIPESLAPSAKNAFSDPAQILGQTLRVYRNTGDFLYPGNLGGEELSLAPNERAVAIQVADSAGLAGLLKPGDRVGITAILPGPTGSTTYGKFLIGGLRVLYITPSFQAEEPAAQYPARQGDTAQEGDTFSVPSGNTLGTARAAEGTVVLAVPVTALLVGYDFSPFGAENATRMVYAADLLPALDQASNVLLSLVLEPKEAASFETSGVYLPDLILTPGPTPTPTATPYGFQDSGTLLTPTPQPEVP